MYYLVLRPRLQECPLFCIKTLLAALSRRDFAGAEYLTTEVVLVGSCSVAFSVLQYDAEQPACPRLC
jgi:hypothetical protein